MKGVQAAFKVYNVAMRTPGKGELTMVELRVGAARMQACRPATHRTNQSLLACLLCSLSYDIAQH